MLLSYVLTYQRCHWWPCEDAGQRSPFHAPRASDLPWPWLFVHHYTRRRKKETVTTTSFREPYVCMYTYTYRHGDIHIEWHGSWIHQRPWRSLLGPASWRSWQCLDNPAYIYIHMYTRATSDTLSTYPPTYIHSPWYTRWDYVAYIRLHSSCWTRSGIDQSTPRSTRGSSPHGACLSDVRQIWQLARSSHDIQAVCICGRGVGGW